LHTQQTIHAWDEPHKFRRLIFTIYEFTIYDLFYYFIIM